MGRFRIVAVLVAATSIPINGQTPPRSAVAAQKPTGGGARIAAHPNFNVLWQAMPATNWDTLAHNARPGPSQFGALFSEPAGVGIVEGNAIPYQPWAADKQKENFRNRWTNDPEAKCYLPGVPRATYMPFPFQIIQGNNRIIIAYEFAAASRIIYLDKVEPVANDSFMGTSLGHWDGDTLVVDVSNLNDKTWFDRSGNFHSDEMHVTERYTPLSADVIRYEASIEDPKVFTRPWKITFPIY